MTRPWSAGLAGAIWSKPAWTGCRSRGNTCLRRPAAGLQGRLPHGRPHARSVHRTGHAALPSVRSGTVIASPDRRACSRPPVPAPSRQLRVRSPPGACRPAQHARAIPSAPRGRDFPGPPDQRANADLNFGTVPTTACIRVGAPSRRGQIIGHREGPTSALHRCRAARPGRSS